MSSTTKRVLATSFRKLLSTRPLDKITVKDIVEDAQVNRQTFYYHFCDIYDMIRWIFDGETQIVSSLENKPDELRGHFCSLLQEMVLEKALVMNAFHSLSREHLEQYLYNVVYSLICDKLDGCCEDLSVSDDDKSFVADFYKYAFVGMLLDWIQRGMKDDPEVLVDKLIHMLDGELRRCLEKFSN